jgi:hypothetical protein
MNSMIRKGQKIMKTAKITGTIAIVCTILGTLLAACGAAAPATPTTDPGAVYTMAAATVQAQLTQAAAANPTAIPPTATAEIKPTEAPTVQLTQQVAVQPALPFAGGTAQVATVLPTTASGINPFMAPTSAQPAGFKVGDIAEWQYNIPGDNATYPPAVPFQMEIGLKNVGSVTWTEQYSLKFIDGKQMSGITVIPLTAPIKPGEKAIFITDLRTPGEPGIYKSLWALTTQNGAEVANGRVFIQLVIYKE